MSDIVASVAKTGVGIAVRGAIGGVAGYLPLILGGALVLSLVAGAGGTIWYRMKWRECVASVAIDVAKAEEKVRTFRDADSEFRRQLSESLRPVIDDLQRQNTNVQLALGKVKSDPRCVGTDAARAFDGVVRPSQSNQADPRPTGQTRP